MLRLNGLELDGNLLTRNDVRPKVNVSERTGSNLSADAVFITDSKILSDSLARVSQQILARKSVENHSPEAMVPTTQPKWCRARLREALFCRLFG